MKLATTILITFLYLTITGQDILPESVEKQYFGISTNYSSGKIIPTTEFVKGNNLKGKPLEQFQSLILKALWQNPGYTDWQKVYNGPYYGVGISISDFYNSQEIGYPISYFGVLGLPCIRLKKLELYSEFQFGLASNWEHYDPVSNPKNLVIGGGLTVHLNIGMHLFYPISKNFDLGSGFSFIHFSNGGFERPNKGFNIYTPSVELKYHFADRPNTRDIKSPGKLKRSNDLYFMAGYGDHQLVEHELDSNYFAIAGISVILLNQISNSVRIGIGTDINYWFGLNANPDGTIGPKNDENLTIGLIIQPELIIDRLTLVGGFGIYARHLQYGNFKQMYQRLGIRFEVYKNVSVGVNIRAVNFILAEFLEFNFGYTIKWEK